jgi:hypothetical protein
MHVQQEGLYRQGRYFRATDLSWRFALRIAPIVDEILGALLMNNVE